ncbi:MAG: hypothetical protein GW938_03050 [Leptospira sp.]|nr:hypothetical protein [Leptospira sp.]NCS95628.1 hypothetical protein [Leptospira sp.]
MLERDSILSRQEKIFLTANFLDHYTEIEIIDLYKWLYFGEFGYEAQNTFLKASKKIPPLQMLLDQIEDERAFGNFSEIVWEPMGTSHKFVSVFVTQYYLKECPLVRLINLMERSSAFRGSRMQFKLDWTIAKEYALSMKPNWTKDDFYQFEDRIGFHQLPILDYSEKYLENYSYKNRIISQKLFFEYFPEFYDDTRLYPGKKFSSIIG